MPSRINLKQRNSFTIQVQHSTVRKSGVSACVSYFASQAVMHHKHVDQARVSSYLNNNYFMAAKAVRVTVVLGPGST